MTITPLRSEVMRCVRYDYAIQLLVWPQVDHPFANEVDHPFADEVDHPFASELTTLWVTNLSQRNVSM